MILLGIAKIQTSSFYKSRDFLKLLVCISLVVLYYSVEHFSKMTVKIVVLACIVDLVELSAYFFQRFRTYTHVKTFPIYLNY